MTDLFDPVDAADRDLALGSAGLLGAFNAAGVLTSADVHVALAIGLIGGETDESVLLAAALACRAVRAGSVCLELDRVDRDLVPDLAWPDHSAWAAALDRSPLVAAGMLRWESGLLYLDRYHEQESQVLDDLAARATSAPTHDAEVVAATLDRVFPASGYDEQREACQRVAQQWTTVITGGPGTGKTTAVAGLLVTLHAEAEARGEPLRIALTAPTGKAAARLQESITAAEIAPQDRGRIAGVEAMTLHRLLRRDPANSTRFRHHRANRLPHDVVVVDETSMVSLTMMARLLEAVRPDARLILVGDPHQLSSVEAGAVLADLVRGYAERPDSPVTALRTSHRFGEEIGALGAAIREGRPDDALEVLAGGHDSVRWVTDPAAPVIRAEALGAALAIRDAAAAGDAAAALAALDRHRLLCAHREGPYGVRHWNRRIEQWITGETGDPLHDRAYAGRPLLVTANNYALGVYNGDSGVVVETPDGPRVALPGGTGDTGAAGGTGHRLLAASRLGDVETMHAMTIHKAQGSQASHVTVLLPDEESRLLTRELFYTAVTRAKEVVTVVGDEAWVRAAIERRAQRASGLAVRLGRPTTGSGRSFATPPG